MSQLLQPEIDRLTRLVAAHDAQAEAFDASAGAEGVDALKAAEHTAASASFRDRAEACRVEIAALQATGGAE